MMPCNPAEHSFIISCISTLNFPELTGIQYSSAGAMVEYLLEKYSDGALNVPCGTPQRAEYLQVSHVLCFICGKLSGSNCCSPSEF